MTDKFYLKEVCGEYKFYEEEDSFPLTEKQILNKLNENEQLKDENKELKENVSRLINEAIIEILDGQRYEGERILNKALRLLE